MPIATQEIEDIEVALPAPLARYGGTTKARLHGRRGPVVVALGGISADRRVCDWWRGLAGSGRTLDPECLRLVGLDFAADLAGALAPSTAEQAEVLAAALDALGIEAADLLVGASYGGMVGLALAGRRPELVRRLAILCAPAAPHPAATAMRELQRRTVAMGLALGSGAEALSIARGLAMTTYRTPEEFAERFDGGIAEAGALATSAPGAYLRARGDAYQAVMTPERFLSLSASIDRHRVDPAAIRQPTLVIGARSDRLVPPEQVEALAAALPDAELHLLDSRYGHDSFLKETARIGPLVAGFLAAA
ncbi:MAG: alpha/beta fold hydrolase [Alphaproteobacteria bacterium]|nr:alpha/beta fold hydrolase [Alphaproteobacteria bacterium]